MRERLTAAAIACTVVTVGAAGASPAVGVESASTPLASPLPSEPTDLGSYAGPIVFEAPDADTVIGVAGRGRYLGRVEVRGDGVIVNDTTMQAYLEGIAEVPLRWPTEALEAQVVAARTYAWWVIRNSRYSGFDICGTVACQVFRGQEVVEGPLGDRWVAAVAATEGEVLVHGDAPILSRYSSSSGGRTRANEEVFTDQGPLPYLRAVDDPYDEVSPWHRWQVTFRRDVLDAILAEVEEFAPAVPVERYEFVPGKPDVVRFTGRDGTVATAPATRFRFGVSEVAAARFPDRYPPRAGFRRMPQTILSSRFAFRVGPDTVLVEGGGFGHGVGMSQWGALGRAQAGHRHEEILAAYYGGIRPTRPGGVPERVRVSVADDADEAVVRGDAPVIVRAGDDVITERAIGAWTVRRRGDGTLGVVAPPGYGAPLIVGPTRVSDARPVEGAVITVEAVVNKPAELVTVVSDGSGRELGRRPAGTATEPGRQSTTWELVGPDGALGPGRYGVALVAVDEDGEAAGDPATIEIVSARPTPAATGSSTRGDGTAAPPPDVGRDRRALLAIVVLAGTGVALAAVGAARAARR